MSDKSEYLKKENALLRDKLVDLQAVDRAVASKIAALEADLAWHRNALHEASNFLLAITNNATLAGRGWEQTLERLKQQKPKSTVEPRHYAGVWTKEEP
jgi:hypothetical protein